MPQYDHSITIAIIGGGPAGVSLCLQLTQAINHIKLKRKLDLILFEKNTDIGLGLPYAIKEEAFCINLPKQHMVLSPGEYHHFSDWLNDNHINESTAFPPRHYFGQYTKERLFTIQNHPELKIITRTKHDVYDIISAENNQYQIFARHEYQEVSYYVDYVILATGHLPSTLFLGLQHKQTNPWDISNYQNLPSHYHVGIVGSRLTAIDVALKLHQQQHKGKITMISRSGLLSSVRGELVVPVLKYLTPDNIKNLLRESNSMTLLQALINLFEQEITRCLPQDRDLWSTINFIKTLHPIQRINYEIRQIESGNTSWKSILSCFYQIIFNIWPKLHTEQQRHFFETYSSLMLTFLCSFPLRSARVIQTMMKDQQLSIHRGLINIEKKGAHFSIQLEQEKSILCDQIFLATGSGHNPETIPLLANLLKRQFIEKHTLGGICINPSTHQVIATNQTFPVQIYALGDLVKGNFCNMIEIGQVVNQGHIIVDQIIKKLSYSSTN